MPGAGSEAENAAEKRCPVCCIPTEDVVKHFRENHPGVEGVVCPHCCKLLSKKCTLNRHIEQVHLGLQIFKVNLTYIDKLCVGYPHFRKWVIKIFDKFSKHK